MIRIALFSVLLVTVSACGGSAAEPPSGFINEPSTTVLVATSVPPSTTAPVVETTVTPATTVEPVDDGTTPSGTEADGGNVSESDSVETEVEAALRLAWSAADEAISAGNPDSPDLLRYFDNQRLRGVQDYIKSNIDDGLEVTVEPATERWIEDIEMVADAEGNPGLAIARFCELYVETVVEDGEVVHDADEYSYLLSWQVFRTDDGWAVSAGEGLVDQWEGAQGCVDSYRS